jgi:hypothetical protein
VGIQVDPPGITATAAPTVTSGAVASIALSSPNNGGAGYTSGAPEVIITGDGVGAKFTATVSGGVVTGFTQVAPGSGYTQANTVVALAPPPSQATAFAFVSGSGISTDAQFGCPIIWAGFGYSSTAPNVTISGGGGTGATATAVLAYPFQVLRNIPMHTGMIPIEVACNVVNGIPGCDGWFNIPIGLSDAGVITYGQRVLANLATGHRAWFELGNEDWNAGDKVNKTAIIGRFTGIGGWDTVIARAAQVHSLLAPLFAAAGRPGDLVRLFGAQFGNSALAAEVVTYANAHNIRVDAIAIAPYYDTPGRIGSIDEVWTTAAEQCGPGTSPWPMTMADYHTFYRHWLLYSASNNGELAAELAATQGYSVPGNPIPMLVAYEGGIEEPISHNSTVSVAGLTHDFFFHPDYAGSVQTWTVAQARAGLAATCYFEFAGMETGDPWVIWEVVGQAGMQPGAGDGSDGRTVNSLWVTDSKAHYADNVAPGLLGFQAAGQVLGLTPTPTPTARRARRWFPGLRRLPVARA